MCDNDQAPAVLDVQDCIGQLFFADWLEGPDSPVPDADHSSRRDTDSGTEYARWWKREARVQVH